MLIRAGLFALAMVAYIGCLPYYLFFFHDFTLHPSFGRILGILHFYAQVYLARDNAIHIS